MTTDPTAQPTPTPAMAALEAYRFAQAMAVTEKARGNEGAERAWLDLLHLLDKAAAILAPKPAPVAVPEGGWRDGDWLVLDDRGVWHGSDDGLLHDERGRVVDADYVFRRGHVVYVHAPREAYGEPNDTTQHAPRTEPVTAPLPSEAPGSRAHMVRIIADRLDAIHVPESADRDSVEMDAEEIARDLLAAGYTLPAADQRARDEGTVRRAVLDAIEDEGPDTENPASRERIRGWRECAQDVRDALDSVQDEGTVRAFDAERLIESIREDGDEGDRAWLAGREREADDSVVAAEVAGRVREEIIAALHADLDENHDEHPEGTCDLCDWAGNIQSIVDGSR